MGSPATSLRRNAAANVAGRSLSALLWLLVTPYALGQLGPDRFGVWSLFFVFGGYVATLDLGMSNGVARFVALAAAREDRRALVHVFRRAMAVSVAAGAIWCLLFIFLRGPFLEVFRVPVPLQGEVERSLVVFAFSMLVFSATQVLHGTLGGFQRLDLANLYFLCGLLLHVTVLVVGLGRGAGLMAAAAAAVSGHALSGVLAAFSALRGIARVPARVEGATVSWRELLGFSATVQATGALATLQLQVGKLFLGGLGRLAWVTQFELGFRVANALWSLPSLMQGAVILAAARASAGPGLDELRRVYAWACRWIFAVAGPLLAGLWLLAPAIFTLWLGPGHGDSAAVARWLAVAFAIATAAGPATAVARGGGWPALETWMVGAALAVNSLACLWGVPRDGPAAAVLALALSYGIAGAGLILVFHRRLAIPVGRWLRETAAPRFLLPAAAAAVLWAFGLGRDAPSRAEALVALTLHGSLFVALALALSWRTGDARAALDLARARLQRAGRPAGEAR